MRKAKVEILCTKEVSESLVKIAEGHNIHLDQSSFIRIEFIEADKVRQKLNIIPPEVKDIILTSTNAVTGLTRIGHTFTECNFYCVGHNTSEKLRKFFPGSGIVTAEKSKSLGEEIIRYNPSPAFVYFCGDRRRDELPTLLRNAGRTLYEIELYRTINNPFFVNKNYDGFLFFSPSAVESFYSMNSISSLSTCFAIGDTTAETLRKFHPGEIIISSRPNPEALIQTTIEYYKNN